MSALCIAGNHCTHAWFSCVIGSFTVKSIWEETEYLPALSNQGTRGVLLCVPRQSWEYPPMLREKSGLQTKAVSETAISATARARSARLLVLKNRQTRAL